MDLNTTRNYKCLAFLSMLYVTLKLITVVLVYKIIRIGPFSGSASVLMIPFWFALGDIIVEVYGYRIAKQLIWTAILCQFLFSFVCAGLITIESPPAWGNQAAYSQVLGSLPRVALASSCAIMCGAFANAYFVSKWKILLKGKYFWLRSLGAAVIGEFVFTVVAYIAAFFGQTTFSTIIELISVSFFTKLALNPILSVPSVYLARYIKAIEKIDTYDFEADFNPFKLNFASLNRNHEKPDVKPDVRTTK